MFFFFDGSRRRASPDAWRLQLPTDCDNVKAKTLERLGFVGRGEGIAGAAVVLISRES